MLAIVTFKQMNQESVSDHFVGLVLKVLTAQSPDSHLSPHLRTSTPTHTMTPKFGLKSHKDATSIISGQ